MSTSTSSTEARGSLDGSAADPKRGRQTVNPIGADRGSGAVPDDGFLTVGWIGRAHGLNGDVLVRLTSDRAERVAPGTILHTAAGPLTVVKAVAVGPAWRVSFAGVTNRNAAEALRRTELRAEPIEIEGVVWVHDLIGATVGLLDGSTLGPVLAVEENPAHDLLVVASDRFGEPKEHLIPMVFVVSIDGQEIVIDPPDGLLEL